MNLIPYPRPTLRRAGYVRLAAICLVFLLALAGCAAPGVNPAQPPNVQATVDAAMKATTEARTNLQAAIQAGVAATAAAANAGAANAAPTAAPIGAIKQPTATEAPVAPPTLVPTFTAAAAPPTLIPAPTAPPPPPTAVPDASVRSETVNMRSGPGTDFGIVNTYPQGTPLSARGRTADGSWIQVAAPDGLTGWISTTVLDVNAPLSALPVAWSAPLPTAIPPTSVPPTLVAPTLVPPTAVRPTPVPPTPLPAAANASFRVNDSSGKWPHAVQFTDQSSNAVSWSWEFGDGGSSSSRNPSHTYQRTGTYTTRLTVRNRAGQSDSASLQITVYSRTGERASTIGGFGGAFGNWGAEESCPSGSFASGFNIKVEGSQGNGDDTSLNAIRLTCTKGGASTRDITSSQGGWGSWFSAGRCDAGYYVTGARLRIEPGQGNGDDTGATNIEFVCGNGEKFKWTHNAEWGNWTDFKMCPADTAVCSIRTRVEPGQGNGDDTALNDVQFACCYTR